MPTNVEKASEVSRKVQIREVTLRRADIETEFAPLVVPNELQMTSKYRARYRRGATDDDRIFVEVDFMLHLGSEDPAGTAHLGSTFLAIYSLSGPAEFSDEALKHFAELNGVYNVWPYWREFVQTAFSRVGLGNVTVPVFRVPVRQLEQASDEQA